MLGLPLGGEARLLGGSGPQAGSVPGGVALDIAAVL
jgi:hypothetical protein